ncbi:MAG: zinc ABC transporter substrate-binding protein [Clostridia bacterium]|nr:zinc ABC transporter substrate-binding protein [Clostridia bacterium]
MKKKIISVFIALALILSCLFLLLSCGNENGKDNGKINIVCSIFPLYDWVSNIVGESNNVDVSLLVSGGGDLHSYDPTAADIIKLIDCDIVVYVGGESDAWLTEALSKNPSDKRQEISLIDYDSITKMAVSDEYILGNDLEHDHDHDHEKQIDEHIWLSLKNAETTAGIICDAVSDLDKENADIYESNLERYTSELSKLHKSITVPKDISPLIFADRFPFVYLFGDYNIPYYAAFSGCTTDVDASPETRVRLASLADELSAEYIFVTESPSSPLAETVIETTKNKNAKILVLDSMQSVTRKDIENGVSYISVMKDNLKILASAIE